MFLSACVKMCENFQDVRKIEVVKDSQRVSERLVEILVSAAESVIAEKNTFTVGLSGGSMVDFLCSGFLRREAKVDLTKWKFFFCDERIVPVHHSESTFGTYKRKLLTILPIDEKQFIPVDTSMTPSNAAIDYEEKLRKNFNDRIPVFDVLLLGMGPDGHTCSLFPGHPLLEERERIVAPIEDSPKEPPCRVTFTFPLLNAAKLCVFALAGDSKSDMVARILQNQEDFPAGRVCPLNGTVLWLLDQRAASQLEVTLET